MSTQSSSRRQILKAMSHKYRRRAVSAGDLINDESSDDESESLLYQSTKSEGGNLDRRASQGCTRPMAIALYDSTSRPGTPTRVLESSLRVSSPNLNRIPKSVRFNFPEQDHYETLSLSRSEMQITNIPDPGRRKAASESVEESISEDVRKLLLREARRHSCSDINTRTKVGDFYFQTMAEPDVKPTLWQRRKTVILVAGLVGICIILVLVPTLIKIISAN